MRAWRFFANAVTYSMFRIFYYSVVDLFSRYIVIATVNNFTALAVIMCRIDSDIMTCCHAIKWKGFSVLYILYLNNRWLYVYSLYMIQHCFMYGLVLCYNSTYCMMQYFIGSSANLANYKRFTKFSCQKFYFQNQNIYILSSDIAMQLVFKCCC